MPIACIFGTLKTENKTLLDHYLTLCVTSRSLGSVFAYYDVSEATLSGFPFVRKALQATVDDRFSTPLIDAVRGVSGICVAQALELYPGSVNDRDVSGTTALHWAVREEDIHAVRLLLSFHADPSVRDYDQWTPLHHAAVRANLTILQALLEAGGNPHAEDIYGRQPLHRAVLYMIKDNVLALIQAGAKAHAVDYVGQSAFVDAAYSRLTCTEEDVLSVFQVLVEHGADVNMVNIDGHRPLDRAIQRNHEIVFRALCQLGVEFDYLDTGGRTILHWVGVFGREKLVLAMMQMEISTVDPDHVDDFGYTALDYFNERQQLTPADLHPHQAIPTVEEEELFHQLLKQMRDSYIGLTDVDSEDDGEEGYDSEPDSNSEEQGDADEEQEQTGDDEDDSGSDEEEEEEWLDAEEVVPAAVS